MIRSKRGTILLPTARFQPSTKPLYILQFDAWKCPRCQLAFRTEAIASSHLKEMHHWRQALDQIDVLPGPPPSTERKLLAKRSPSKPAKRPREEAVIISGPDGVNMEISTENGKWYCPACRKPRATAGAISRHLSSNCPALQKGLESSLESHSNIKAPDIDRHPVSLRLSYRQLGVRLDEKLSRDPEGEVKVSLSTKAALDTSIAAPSPEPQVGEWAIVPADPIDEAEFENGFRTKFRFKRLRPVPADEMGKHDDDLDEAGQRNLVILTWH